MSKAVSIASALRAPVACQSRLARQTRPAIDEGEDPGPRVGVRVDAFAPREHVDEAIVVVVVVAQDRGEQCRRGFHELEGCQIGRFLARSPLSAVSRRSDSRKAFRSAVSGSSAGGRVASASSSASVPSWTNDSARSSLLAKYRKNVRSATSTASGISRTVVCSYPLA